MRNRQANKVATKRLKMADRFLKEHRKEEFYDEVLRALWGYFSDKLSIPLAQLSRENVGAELYKQGIDESLITTFMQILDACEFARYAPAESDHAMDQLYNQTIEAIGKMENQLKTNGKK
jgi:hypothetical protein